MMRRCLGSDPGGEWVFGGDVGKASTSQVHRQDDHQIGRGNGVGRHEFLGGGGGGVTPKGRQIGAIPRMFGQQPEIYQSYKVLYINQTVINKKICRSTTRRWEFPQDGAPIHRSASTSRWLRLHGVKLFNEGKWPVMSPDLNPIEHLKPHVTRAIQGEVYTSREGLWSAIESAFRVIPREFVIRLYNSMPRRLNAVIEAKGGHSKY